MNAIDTLQIVNRQSVFGVKNGRFKENRKVVTGLILSQ